MSQLQRVPFGRTGIQVAEMCLGTMMFGGKTDLGESTRILHRALDLGADFIDTAPMYENGTTEEIVGRALRGKRERVFLATKVHSGVTRQHILSSADESLRRLQTDHMDLFQIHWPKTGMNLAEIMEVLDLLVRQGKTRLVGCCNFPAYVMAQLNAIAAGRGLATLVSFQPPYNVLERGIEVECLPYCLAEGMAVLPYRPLSIGLLTGKYRQGQPLPSDSRGLNDARIPRWLERFGGGIEKLAAFARARGVSTAAVAVAWVRCHPAVTAPIVGVSTVEQLEESMRAMRFRLSPAEREEVSSFFDTEVKEIGGGDFPALRRELGLVVPWNQPR